MKNLKKLDELLNSVEKIEEDKLGNLKGGFSVSDMNTSEVATRATVRVTVRRGTTCRCICW